MHACLYFVYCILNEKESDCAMTGNEAKILTSNTCAGMMAAVHRRDTDVEKREERISHFKVIRSRWLVCATLCNGIDRSLRN